MKADLTAKEELERAFPEARCKIIEIAADLDRIDRGDNGEAARRDSRMSQIREALKILTRSDGDRAKACQLVFSLPYDESWSPPNRE